MLDDLWWLIQTWNLKRGGKGKLPLISLTLLVFVVSGNFGYQGSIWKVFLYLVFLHTGKCSAGYELVCVCSGETITWEDGEYKLEK